MEKASRRESGDGSEGEVECTKILEKLLWRGSVALVTSEPEGVGVST